MSYTIKERQEYNVRRVSICEALGITKNKYNSFRRDANRLHKHYEDDCNGYSDSMGNWDENKSNRAEAIERQIENRVTEEAKALGLYVYFQTDPRGATIYLDTKPISQNNYTSAYCIY
jgi:hypothetical protein